ncbi:MAG: hypothetical protein K2R98_14390 [Gemmataceae bacterium]|nr:hypothetical protein [Gemmataceae bacterium]
MIAFPCKQCGKRFERPVDACGTLVFCDCGTGTRVPWESTLPPTAEPMPVNVPARSWSPPEPERPLGQRRFHEPQPRDRAYCLNHSSAATEHTCADCGETFCAACVVTVQGGVRCGPCKNHRVRGVQRPARLAVLAIFAPLIALAAGGFWLILILMTAGGKPNASFVLGLGTFGLLPQLTAFTLGALALTKVESSDKTSGRDWAITGMVAALVMAVLIVQLSFVVLQVAD